MTETVVRVIDLHVMRQRSSGPEYLVMRRSKGQMYAGIWQGVTGKILDGETAWAAALRELDEETGLKPVRLWTVDHVNTFYEAYGDWVNLIPVFGAEVNSEEVRLSAEHDAAGWYTVDEAARLLLWGQQREGLKAFHDMLTVTTEKLRWMEIDMNGQR